MEIDFLDMKENTFGRIIDSTMFTFDTDNIRHCFSAEENKLIHITSCKTGV